MGTSEEILGLFVRIDFRSGVVRNIPGEILGTIFGKKIGFFFLIHKAISGEILEGFLEKSSAKLLAKCVDLEDFGINFVGNSLGRVPEEVLEINPKEELLQRNSRIKK